jgi:cytochrome c oxidase subunit 3
MSTAETTLDHGGHDHHPSLGHQFEDMGQQTEIYVTGMWVFLVTEVMFFGALFVAYTLYRWNYQVDFYYAHAHLNVLMGGINTVVLLISSFFVVMAVQGAQKAHRTQVLGFFGATQVCALTFLTIKFFEYQSKVQDGLYPGTGFTTNPQMFYGLYFAMTGLHGLHVIVGILVIGALMRLWVIRAKSVTQDFVFTEMVGLYWHFVDLVWIFLFPLFYLQAVPAGAHVLNG